MKRNIFLFSLIAASMFLLVACGDITGMKNPGQAVLKMYQAAVENDQETLNELLTYFREYDGDQMEVTEELKDQVYDFGGLENVKPTVLRKADLHQEVRDGLGQTFRNNC